MINIKLISVGTCKERYFKEACAEYQKRLGAFCKLEIIETTESKRDGIRQGDINEILDFEGDKILSEISKSDYVIALCIEGKPLTSEELSSKIDTTALYGNSKISFIIGGSLGLSEKVKNRADLKLSLSKMTFPHQLARVALLEQIYRSFTIIRGVRYHK